LTTPIAAPPRGGDRSGATHPGQACRAGGVSRRGRPPWGHDCPHLRAGRRLAACGPRVLPGSVRVHVRGESDRCHDPLPMLRLSCLRDQPPDCQRAPGGDDRRGAAAGAPSGHRRSIRPHWPPARGRGRPWGRPRPAPGGGRARRPAAPAPLGAARPGVWSVVIGRVRTLAGGRRAARRTRGAVPMRPRGDGDGSPRWPPAGRSDHP
jgi:hypothetical protein